jgi:hypothetical protein
MASLFIEFERSQSSLLGEVGLILVLVSWSGGTGGLQLHGRTGRIF